MIHHRPERPVDKRLLGSMTLSAVVLACLLVLLGGVTIFQTYVIEDVALKAAPPKPPSEVPPPQPDLTHLKRSASDPLPARIMPKPDAMVIPDVKVAAISDVGRVGFGGFGKGGFELPQMQVPDFESLFGGTNASPNSLEGIFYDFKQDRGGDAQRVDYVETVQDFVDRSWNTNAWRSFFQAEQRLYASSFLIPMISATEAPKAYNVADQVQPAAWAAHYRGQFMAPRDDRYRFVGCADDLLIVRVNGKVVLDGSRRDTPVQAWDHTWDMEFADGQNRQWRAGNTEMAFGDWVSLKKGEVNEIEILVGERPGGQFGVYLFIQDRSDARNLQMEGNRPRMNAFLLRPLSAEGRRQIQAQLNYPVNLDGPYFGVEYNRARLNQ